MRRVKNRFFFSEQGVTMHVCVSLCMQVGRGILDRFTLSPLLERENVSSFCEFAMKGLFVFSRFIGD